MSIAAPTSQDDALERLLGDVAIGIRSQLRSRPSTDEAIALGADVLSVVYVLEGVVRLPAGTGLPEHLAAGDALRGSGDRASDSRDGCRAREG